MISEAKKKAQYRYDKNNTSQVMLKLNNSTDADILMKLQNEENKQGYIKDLIRNDLKASSEVLSLDSIKCLVIPVAKKYDLDKISIFGSYARGEANAESDIDIVIDGGNYKGLFEFYGVKESFERALDKTVDLITRSSLDQKKSIADQSFKNNVLNEEVVIYGKS